MTDQNANIAPKVDNVETGVCETQQVLAADGIRLVPLQTQTDPQADPILIHKPAAGQAAQFALSSGEKYNFDFQSGDIKTFTQNGDDLTIVFSDESVLVLANFQPATTGDSPSILVFGGNSDPADPAELTEVARAENVAEGVVDTTPDETELEEPQAETRDEQTAENEIIQETLEESLASIAPAAGGEVSAQRLAQIEPEAGNEDTGDAGDTDNTGFTFNDPSITPVGVLAAVGPLDSTRLQYDVQFANDTLLPGEERSELNGRPDDQPILTSPASHALDETNLGPLSQTGQIIADFGNDGPGTITPNGNFVSSGSQTAGVLTSNGVVVIVTPTANGYVGTAGGAPVFDLVLDPDTGNYTFTLTGTLDHADGTDPNDVITLEFGVVAEDGDGDQAVTKIVVSVADDAPAAIAPDSNTINENALDGGPIVINDTLVVDFGQDGAGSITPDGVTSVTGVGVLTSNGQPITITATADGYIGTLPGGVTAFELEVNPLTGAYVFTQNVPLDHDPASDTIALNFGIELHDFDGDSVITTITINIVDSVPEINDKPKVGAGIENVDETALPGGSTASGSLDVDFGNDIPGALTPDGAITVSGSVAGGTLTSGGDTVTITQTANGYVGTINGGVDTVFTLTIDPANGDYTFTQDLPLDHADITDHDDVITLEFGVVATDGDGDTDSGSITINVADDGPSIKSKWGAVDEDNLDGGSIVVTRSMNHDFGEDGAGDIHPTGKFSALFQVGGQNQTLESMGQEITVVATANGYIGTVDGGTTTIFTLSIDPANGDHTYTQFKAIDHPDGSNPDDVIWLKFEVEIVDADGDTATAIIGIDVHDGGPVAVDDSANVAKEDTVVTGNVLTNDDGGPDAPATLTAIEFNGTTIPVVAGIATVIAGKDGTLSIHSDGSYTYTITGPRNDALGDVFKYTLTDFDGDTSQANLSIDITPDDQPIIAEPKALSVDETDIDGTAPVGSDSDTNTVTANFGADGPGTFEVGLAADITFTGATGNALTSNGDAVSITIVGNSYVGTDTGGTIIFRLDIDAQSGKYTFTQFEPLDHADTTNPDDVIQLSFDVIAKDSDGDTASGKIIVNVLDDGPSIKSKWGAVDEDNLDAGPIVVTRSMNHDFGEDGAGDIHPTGKFSALFQVGGQNQTLESMGQEITVVATANGYIGTVDGGTTTIFTLSIDPANGDHTYTQFKAIDHPDGTNPDDVIWLKFEVEIVDADGDTATAIIGIDVHDGGPVAHDDCVDLGTDNQTANGNVLANDEIGPDVSGSVTKITFGGQDYNAPESGTISVLGEYGTIIIDAQGSYTYEAFAATQKVFSFHKSDPSGSDKAGNIDDVSFEYNSTTQLFSFEMVVDETAEGFTLAVSGGENPKGHGGELALIYFDVSTGTPVITIYNYNGLNTQTSWQDGSVDAGIQSPDKILSSLINGDEFNDITVTTDGNGNNIFSFIVDASTIQNYNPSYGNPSDWNGVEFGHSIGVWLHPVSNLDTSYGADGFLTQWDAGAQSWYDVSDQQTTWDYTKSEGTDVFTYTLTDADGDTSQADLKFNTQQNDHHSEEERDTLYATAENDTFLFEAIDDEVKTIEDFTLGEDVLDVSALLQGYDALQDSIDDFVFATEREGNTTISVDVDGSEGPAVPVEIAVLEAVTGLDIEAITNNGETTL